MKVISGKAIAAILVVVAIVIAGGFWYYSSRIQHSDIEKVLKNPREFEGKVVTIEGEVTDRTAFFAVVKFFRVKDKTGEITVVTKRALPALKSVVRVKGKVDELFALGDLKLVVLVEESVEGKDAATDHKQ